MAIIRITTSRFIGISSFWIFRGNKFIFKYNHYPKRNLLIYTSNIITLKAAQTIWGRRHVRQLARCTISPSSLHYNSLVGIERYKYNYYHNKKESDP